MCEAGDAVYVVTRMTFRDTHIVDGLLVTGPGSLVLLESAAVS